MKKQTSGERLSILRGLLNRTQDEFANDLETTQGNISNLETGQLLMSGQFLMRLAEKYPQTNMNWLMKGGNEKPFRF